MQTTGSHFKRRGLALAATLTLLAGCAANPPRPAAPQNATAAPTLRPNPAPAFALELWSGSNPATVGERLNLKLRGNADIYLSLYEIASSGHTARLFENHRVRAGEAIAFPGSDSRVEYRFSPPQGTEKLILLGTRQPVNWLQAKDLDKPAGIRLRLSPGDLMTRLDRLVSQLPATDWNALIVPVTLRLATPRTPTGETQK